MGEIASEASDTRDFHEKDMRSQMGDSMPATAAPTASRRLSTTQALPGEASNEMAASLGNLNAIQEKLNDLAGAEGANLQSVAILEKLHGRETPGVAKRLENLAYVLHSPQARPAHGGRRAASRSGTNPAAQEGEVIASPVSLLSRNGYVIKRSKQDMRNRKGMTV